MYSKKPIISGAIILFVILNLRLSIGRGESMFNILSLMSTIPIILSAGALAYLGYAIRSGLLNDKMKSLRYFINFIMAIVANEMIVWVSILFRSNYGLTGFFIPLFFLSYGYFFIKKLDKNPYEHKDDIFELYDTETKEDDIFEEYFKNQNKDRFHNE